MGNKTTVGRGAGKDGVARCAGIGGCCWVPAEDAGMTEVAGVLGIARTTGGSETPPLRKMRRGRWDDGGG